MKGSFGRSWAVDRLWMRMIPIFAWALMSVPAFWVLPAGDDWTSFSPLHALSWTLLRPNILWRPFEPILRWLMGVCGAWTFPAGPHALVVAGHALTGWFSYRLLKDAGVSAAGRTLATSAMMLFPGSAAAVWSVDSAIQTWSTACGLWAVLLLSKAKNRTWPLLWLLPAFLAMLWKESGLAWSFAGPCLVAHLSSWKGAIDWKATVRALLLGGLVLGFYLTCRISLADGNPSFGGANRYSLTLSPITTLCNLSLLLGVVATPIDTLALLGHPQSLFLAMLTAVMGIPFAILTTWAWTRTYVTSRTLLAVASVVLTAGPHLALPHVSEMYAHPIIATTVLMIAPVFERVFLGRRRVWAAMTCLVIGILISDGHKLERMIASGNASRAIGRRMVEKQARPVHLVCGIPASESPLVYSVFQLPAAPGSGWGHAVLHEWGWPRNTAFVRATSTADCRTRLADMVVAFRDNESFDIVPP